MKTKVILAIATIMLMITVGFTIPGIAFNTTHSSIPNNNFPLKMSGMQTSSLSADNYTTYLTDPTVINDVLSNNFLNATSQNANLLNSVFLNSAFLNSAFLNSAFLNSAFLNSAFLNSAFLNSTYENKSYQNN